MDNPIKDPIELYQMLLEIKTDDFDSKKPTIEYIESLHRRIRTYDSVVSQIVYTIDNHKEQF